MAAGSLTSDKKCKSAETCEYTKNLHCKIVVLKQMKLVAPPTLCIACPVTAIDHIFATYITGHIPATRSIITIAFN